MDTEGTAQRRPDESIAWVSDQSPSRTQTWFAICVAACALVGFVVVLPYAKTPLVHLNAFFPTLDAIVFVTDLVTAVLLFAQFSISRSRALLALASGYLFTALIVIPHALTFAGAFSPTGLLGAGIQTGSWLFIFWHIGFSAALLAYALLRFDYASAPIAVKSPARVIVAFIICTLALVIGLTWLATAGAHYLPAIILDASRISPIVRYPIGFTIILSALALLALAVRRRPSVLDQWLMVVAFVSIGELAFSGLIPTVRFSAGFYAGRGFSLVTASLVLIVLLEETTRLYARLLEANERLRREQNNKLINLEAMAASIAHEVRQPLTAIACNGEAALQFLKDKPANLQEAANAIQDMVDASHGASGVFAGFRTLFGREEFQKVPIDINDVAIETIGSLKADLAKHQITTRFALESPLRPILGNKHQMRELTTNLVCNAIDAMGSVAGDRRLTIKTTQRANHAVVLAVEDTGPGFDEKALARLFEAFVTTKPEGMGLGLAICRLIVERHGGSISASNAIPQGARIQVLLPTGD